MKSFRERFNLPDTIQNAEERFINRTQSFLGKFFDSYDSSQSRVVNRAYKGTIKLSCDELLAHHLGLKMRSKVFDDFMLQSFHNCLATLEMLYHILFEKVSKTYMDQYNLYILNSLSREPLLKIRWENGYFLPRGADELDKTLIDEVLSWLSNSEYQNVKNTFANSLDYLNSGRSNQIDLKSSIREAYESLETLSKIITGKTNSDLSENRERFVKSLKLNKEYATFLSSELQNYIKYGNYYRHGKTDPKSIRVPNFSEAESFVYLTGVFIRLVIQSR